MSLTKDGSPASVASNEAPADTKKDRETQRKRVGQTSAPDKEAKGHKIVLYVSDAIYNAMVHRAYQRQQRIEQLAEEILLAKFSE